MQRGEIILEIPAAVFRTGTGQRSSEDFAQHVALHVGQAHVAAAEAVRESGVPAASARLNLATKRTDAGWL